MRRAPRPLDDDPHSGKHATMLVDYRADDAEPTSSPHPTFPARSLRKQLANQKYGLNVGKRLQNSGKQGNRLQTSLPDVRNPEPTYKQMNRRCWLGLFPQILRDPSLSRPRSRPGERQIEPGGFSITSPKGGTRSWRATLFDPATGQSISTGSMSIPRDSHTLTLLANGRMLAAGSYRPNTKTKTTISVTATAELFTL